MKCKSCGDMWFDTKDDAEESMESLIAKQICENPRSVYYGDDEVVEPEEKEVVEEPIVEPGEKPKVAAKPKVPPKPKMIQAPNGKLKPVPPPRPTKV